MEQKSTQDYLKAVYSLARNGDLVSTTEISHKLDVAPASVTEMLKKLSEEGFIKYSPYHGSTLTEKGLHEAQRVARKHRLLEKFLSDVLHIGKDKGHTQPNSNPRIKGRQVWQNQLHPRRTQSPPTPLRHGTHARHKN